MQGYIADVFICLHGGVHGGVSDRHRRAAVNRDKLVAICLQQFRQEADERDVFAPPSFIECRIRSDSARERQLCLIDPLNISRSHRRLFPMKYSVPRPRRRCRRLLPKPRLVWTVQAIEKQKVKPQFKTIQALSKAFGVQPDDMSGK